jgi:hypothetical protein
MQEQRLADNMSAFMLSPFPDMMSFVIVFHGQMALIER